MSEIRFTSPVQTQHQSPGQYTPVWVNQGGSSTTTPTSITADAGTWTRTSTAASYSANIKVSTTISSFAPNRVIGFLGDDPNPASPTQGQIQQAQAPVSNAPTIGE